MATKTKATLVAIYRDMASAEDAVNELKAHGFSSSDIYLSSEGPEYTGTLTGGEAEARGETHRHGGIRGWFRSIFGTDDHEDQARYEEFTRSGNVLVSVDARDEDVDRAADILNNYSPVEMHSGTAGTAGTANVPSGTATEQARSIPVAEEELKVGKRAVLRGGVRVYARTVEEPVEENVSLQEEHVRVDRQPADRPASESDFRTGDEQTIEVKEYAEEPVVSKEARVVEDIRVGKDKTQRTETVRDKVRRTEAEVENIDESNPVPGSKKNPTGR